VEWILSRNDFEYLARMLTRSGRKNTFTDADVAEYKKAWSQRGALTGMLNWYRAIVRRGIGSAFSRKKSPARRVHVPTVILWGKRDVALSSDMAQPSIDLCDNGGLDFFDKATHWVQQDASDEVNQKLIQFMR
jgi:pimeloyl-ACP methyl ester carboxylesterase